MKWVSGVGTLLALTVLYTLLGQGVQSRVFSPCELTRELYTGQRVDWKLIPDFVCLAEHASGLNSSYVRNYGFNSIRYGLFRAHNENYCRDEFGIRNMCHTNCSELLGDDITKSVECAMQIYSDSGFGFWTTWTENCKGHDLRHYLRACGVVDGQTPPRLTSSSNERTQLMVLDAEDQFVECRASGTPPPAIFWRYNTTKYPELIPTVTESVGSEPLSLRTSRLLFPKVEWRHSGSYSCYVESLAGEATGQFIVKVVEEEHQQGGVDADEKSGLFYILVGGLPTLVCFVLIGGAVRVYRRRPAIKPAPSSELASEVPDITITSLRTENIDLEMCKCKVVVHKERILGSGRFGHVFMGTVVASGHTVAVKTVPTNKNSRNSRKALLREIKILAGLGRHPHIVNLIGARTSAMGDCLLFVEFCPLGDLEAYLRKMRESFVECSPALCAHTDFKTDGRSVEEHYWTTSQVARLARLGTCDLLRWTIQIATAMEYLASKNIVHGDLATRNVLLVDKQHVKVADFGLAKNLGGQPCYIRRDEIGESWVPWRSLAIESLAEAKLSVQSDVWSYGVTLWEIFTLGDVPYSTGANCSAEFIAQLKEGLRLPKPQHAPTEVYSEMLSCWHLEPKQRPTMMDLKERLLQIGKQACSNYSF